MPKEKLLSELDNEINNKNNHDNYYNNKNKRMSPIKDLNVQLGAGLK